MATQFAIFKSAVCQVLAKLEAQNFITRESNPNNHRVFHRISRERSYLSEIKRRSRKYFLMKHFSDIDLEQLQNIVQTMKKVNASISSSNR
ncbi:MarR family transcriptional regulator [Bacillus sp. ISL-53]|nr:MarR family transcriptional regulator [Bacillus sp. ISL-53]